VGDRFKTRSKLDLYRSHAIETNISDLQDVFPDEEYYHEEELKQDLSTSITARDKINKQRLRQFIQMHSQHQIDNENNPIYLSDYGTANSNVQSGIQMPKMRQSLIKMSSPSHLLRSELVAE
jgi:hypothetical protein